MYSQHVNRFSDCVQVLSTESLSSLSYFEVDWVEWGFYLALSYKSIKRKGASSACRFGHNEKSWVLHCEKNSYEFCHNGVSQVLSGTHSSKVGVYPDQKEGVWRFIALGTIGCCFIKSRPLSPSQCLLDFYFILLETLPNSVNFRQMELGVFRHVLCKIPKWKIVFLMLTNPEWQAKKRKKKRSFQSLS